MAEQRVKLRSSDDEMFEVDKAVAFESQAVKNMVKDRGKDAVISLPNVSIKILAKVIEYCRYHVDNQEGATDDKPAASEDDIKAWDADFVKVDQATLFDLILAANYLNIKNLQYMDSKSDENIHWQFIKCAMSSVVLTTRYIRAR